MNHRHPLRILVLILICLSLSKSSTVIEMIPNMKVLLSSSYSFAIPYQKCAEIIIPNSYKKLSMNLTSQNIERTILTDSKLIKCDESISSIGLCCAQNATFCMENINPTTNTFNVNYCLESSYLYAFASTANIAGTITVETDATKGQGCQIAEFSEETECSNIGISNCKDQSKCHSNCQYVDCLKSNKAKIFSMCLPVNFTLTDMVQRCSNHIDFDGNEEYIHIEKCTRTSNNNTKEQSSSHKFFKFIAVVFGVLALAVFMASVYYRFKMAMDVNRPPFNPPWFCPNFIFPRLNPNPLL